MSPKGQHGYPIGLIMLYMAVGAFLIEGIVQLTKKLRERGLNMAKKTRRELVSEVEQLASEIERLLHRVATLKAELDACEESNKKLRDRISLLLD